ncbi:YaaA family protein [Microbacterium sp. P04]|uniref:YaaA family protein n=1 Tax=Microbacterium sp. P04 TaxID=3366947 RepID=UPI0037476B01
MLVLLPPSETKRTGGTARAVRLDDLAFPELRPQRELIVGALVALSADTTAALRVLKLGERQRADLADNLAFSSAPTLPAIERYTGVLYDGIDASTLDPAARRWLGAHVAIHSAPLGPVAALDRIPSYRLAAGITLPGVPPLRRVWRDAVTAALAAARPRFVLDLRSEAYTALGPVPAGTDSVYVRVVTDGEDGTARALNHFNKHAKGELVRSLALARPRISRREQFEEWARGAGWDVRTGAAGELQLVV